MSESPTKRAYSYLRVSSAGQAGGGRDGYRRQRAAVALAGEALGLVIVREYSDDVSGDFDLKARPSFLDMVGGLSAGGVDTVVVESLSRLARSYVIQENMLMYLAGRGLSLIAADTRENVTEAIQADPMKKALVQMQGVFAELEKNTLVGKLRAARERVKAETGRCGGRKPYGSYPGEAGTLCRMVELSRRGGWAWVARRLDGEGLRPRHSGFWDPRVVKGIVMRASGIVAKP